MIVNTVILFSDVQPTGLLKFFGRKTQELHVSSYPDEEVDTLKVINEAESEQNSEGDRCV